MWSAGEQGITNLTQLPLCSDEAAQQSYRAFVKSGNNELTLVASGQTPDADLQSPPQDGDVFTRALTALAQQGYRYVCQKDQQLFANQNQLGNMLGLFRRFSECTSSDFKDRIILTGLSAKAQDMLFGIMNDKIGVSGSACTNPTRGSDGKSVILISPNSSVLEMLAANLTKIKTSLSLGSPLSDEIDSILMAINGLQSNSPAQLDKKWQKRLEAQQAEDEANQKKAAEDEAKRQAESKEFFITLAIITTASNIFALGAITFLNLKRMDQQIGISNQQLVDMQQMIKNAEAQLRIMQQQADAMNNTVTLEGISTNIRPELEAETGTVTGRTEALRQALRLASTTQSRHILVVGESGVGKDVVRRMVMRVIATGLWPDGTPCDLKIVKLFQGAEMLELSVGAFGESTHLTGSMENRVAAIEKALQGGRKIVLTSSELGVLLSTGGGTTQGSAGEAAAKLLELLDNPQYRDQLLVIGGMETDHHNRFRTLHRGGDRRFKVLQLEDFTLAELETAFIDGFQRQAIAAEHERPYNKEAAKAAVRLGEAILRPTTRVMGVDGRPRYTARAELTGRILNYAGTLATEDRAPEITVDHVIRAVEELSGQSIDQTEAQRIIATENLDSLALREPETPRTQLDTARHVLLSPVQVYGMLQNRFGLEFLRRLEISETTDARTLQQKLEKAATEVLGGQENVRALHDLIQLHEQRSAQHVNQLTRTMALAELVEQGRLAESGRQILSDPLRASMEALDRAYETTLQGEEDRPAIEAREKDRLERARERFRKMLGR